MTIIMQLGCALGTTQTKDQEKKTQPIFHQVQPTKLINIRGTILMELLERRGVEKMIRGVGEETLL